MLKCARGSDTGPKTTLFLSHRNEQEVASSKASFREKAGQVLHKEPRQVPWACHQGSVCFEVLSDSGLCVDWLTGLANVGFSYRQCVSLPRNGVHSCWQSLDIVPWLPWSDFLWHIYRAKQLVGRGCEDITSISDVRTSGVSNETSCFQMRPRHQHLPDVHPWTPRVLILAAFQECILRCLVSAFRSLAVLNCKR